MAFQPRGGSGESNPRVGGLSHGNPSGSLTDSSLDQLVEQIVDAVRDRLISRGVPLPVAESAARETVTKPAAPGTPGTGGTELSAMLRHGADRIGHVGETPFQPHLLQGDAELAAKIDHTLLKPDATKEQIQRMCEEARRYSFATVCVNSANVGLTAELLKGSSVKAIAVVGFPLGAASTASKAFEAREAVQVGAREIDMVINIGALKSRDYAHVLEDIRQVVEASRPYPVKVILETAELNHDEKAIACALSKAAGAAFVKTSTGFGSGGATAEDIELMRRVVGPDMGVKASGGIRTFEDADRMIKAGATRIGASASVAIVTRKGGTDGDKAAKGKAPGGAKPFKSGLY